MAAATIMHVDMDAFYASVEVRDDPSLAGKPLVVGGTGRRGVVASCSYEARAFGIRSAMPSARARSLCPHAVFVPGRFDRYQEASAAIHAVFEDVTPLVEGIALDEAFLDVTGAERLLGPAPTIAVRLRAQVAAATGLACSVGVAPVKFLAKLASEAAKPVVGPDGPRPGPGVVVIEPGSELAFLHPLPVEALWGVGPATAERLRRLGLTTVGELADVPRAVLEQAVGRAHGTHLHRLAHAVDERSVVPHRAAKSVGHEETYATDRHEQEACRIEVLRMADAVAARLRAAGTAGRTVTLKVRFGDFTTITRSRTVARPIDTARQVAALAGGLLATVDVGSGVRLLGVSVTNLAAPATPQEQMHLALDAAPPGARIGRAETATATASTDATDASTTDTAPTHVDTPDPAGDDEATARAWAAAADAVDLVRGRYGASSVGPAALLDAAGLRLKRQGDTQWGPSAPPAGG